MSHTLYARLALMSFEPVFYLPSSVGDWHMMQQCVQHGLHALSPAPQLVLQS